MRRYVFLLVLLLAMFGLTACGGVGADYKTPRDVALASMSFRQSVSCPPEARTCWFMTTLYKAEGLNFISTQLGLNNAKWKAMKNGNREEHVLDLKHLRLTAWMHRPLLLAGEEWEVRIVKK